MFGLLFPSILHTKLTNPGFVAGEEGVVVGLGLSLIWTRDPNPKLSTTFSCGPYGATGNDIPAMGLGVKSLHLSKGQPEESGHTTQNVLFSAAASDSASG